MPQSWRTPFPFDRIGAQCGSPPFHDPELFYNSGVAPC